MPVESKAQLRFVEANPEKFGGKKKVKEWEVSGAAYQALPEHVGEKKHLRPGSRNPKPRNS